MSCSTHWICHERESETWLRPLRRRRGIGDGAPSIKTTRRLDLRKKNERDHRYLLVGLERIPTLVGKLAPCCRSAIMTLLTRRLVEVDYATLEPFEMARPALSR